MIRTALAFLLLTSAASAGEVEVAFPEPASIVYSLLAILLLWPQRPRGGRRVVAALAPSHERP
jgi:hypothetical protein